MSEDISALKNLELSISEALIKLEHDKMISIFDSIDEVVYITDPQTYEVLYTNNSASKALGYTNKSEIIGKRCYSVFQGKEAPCSFCTNKYLFGPGSTGVHIWEFKNNLNGHWYHCIDKAINWLDGRSVRFEMAIDITEHKNLVEELKEKEKFFTDVFSSIQDGISILDKEMFAQPRKL